MQIAFICYTAYRASVYAEHQNPLLTVLNLCLVLGMW